MAKIYGQIDSLKQLLSILNSNGIYFLKSLEDIKTFRQEYNNNYLKLVEEVKIEYELELSNAKIELETLQADYLTKIKNRERELIIERDNIQYAIKLIPEGQIGIFCKIKNEFKRIRLEKRKRILTNQFEGELKKPYLSLEKTIRIADEKIKYLENNKDSIASKRISQKTMMIRSAKNILEEYNTLFIGAIGEQKAVDELAKLPDSYHIINNFKLNFNKPIFNRKTGETILSVQADHIVVGPTGVFLVETKNWSQESIKNENLYSPVDQIKRSSYALFIYLNNAVNKRVLSLARENWGNKKVSIRNIILMIRGKPNKEFQFVKLLNLSEICSYITYFNKMYDDEEVQNIVEYLM